MKAQLYNQYFKDMKFKNKRPKSFTQFLRFLFQEDIIEKRYFLK